MRFQIVLRTEQALTAGLALAARDRAQRVEAAGDGREEAFLGLHICRDRPEQGRLRLVRPVRSAEPLNSSVRFPAGFEQIMDAQPRVPGREFGVVAAASTASIGEDQDALLVVHEGLRLGEIGGRRTVLDHEPIDTASARLADDAARAAGDLGDGIGPEMLDDLVERAWHGWQAGKLLDQRVAPGDRLTTFDGLAVAIDRTR
ncbi:hypothetical protein L598_002700000130 [Mesorhizobium sp. J18]|nr:hypothetical protein L598_002700000130 [Mesorhizobium sp. J18]